jgi:cell division protein FtsL
MNVAVKTLSRITILPRILIKPLAARSYFSIVVLAVILLLTSFGIICVQNINRQLTNNLQTLQMANVNLHNQWSQLLLEQSTWTAATRIEQIARHNLKMITPKTQHILTIEP